MPPWRRAAEKFEKLMLCKTHMCKPRWPRVGVSFLGIRRCAVVVAAGLAAVVWTDWFLSKREYICNNVVQPPGTIKDGNRRSQVLDAAT